MPYSRHEDRHLYCAEVVEEGAGGRYSLMPLNFGAGDDCWEYCGQPRKPNNNHPTN